jgi:hypothetical protein
VIIFKTIVCREVDHFQFFSLEASSKRSNAFNQIENLLKILITFFIRTLFVKVVIYAVLRIRIRDPVLFTPWIRELGSGSGMNFFRIPDPRAFFLTLSLESWLYIFKTRLLLNFNSKIHKQKEKGMFPFATTFLHRT